MEREELERLINIGKSDMARRLALANNNPGHNLADREVCPVCFDHQCVMPDGRGGMVNVKCPGCGGGKSG